MNFTAGTKLGPYEVIQPIGAGGFGQVYKARDTRLNRFVAIKVLPDHLSSNSELKTRFEYEAKTLASLSHRSRSRFQERHRVGDRAGACNSLESVAND
jgi:serine/threonine protein kinase